MFPLPIYENHRNVPLKVEVQVALRFSDMGIGDEEIKMLRRVHFYACGANDLEPDSDGGTELGRMLFHLYQQGVRSEVALMQMLTKGSLAMDE